MADDSIICTGAIAPCQVLYTSGVELSKRPPCSSIIHDGGVNSFDGFDGIAIERAYPKVIELTGHAGVGKDFIAKLLASELNTKGKTCTIVHFADVVKRVLGDTLGIGIKQIESLKSADIPVITIKPYAFDEANEILANTLEMPKQTLNTVSHSYTMRELLQRFATDAMQTNMGANVWVERMLETLMLLKTDYVIIADVRFKHEIFPFALVARVDDYKDSSDMHISEQEYKAIRAHFVIDNSKHRPNLNEMLEGCLSLC